MNCYIHNDRPAASFCRACGRAVCPACQRPAEGTVFCPEHVPVSANAFTAGGPAGGTYPNSNLGANPYAQSSPPPPYAAPPPAVAPVNTSPGLAFLLGIIPGVGAIYNGQYIKGLVHAGLFGLLVSLISNNESGGAVPFFGILLSGFFFYMPFEAYHTAKRRQSGIPVEEWSSLSRGPLPMATGRTPVGPIILIGIGVLFLLDTMNLIEFRQIGRFWPLILIAVGVSMLYSRMAPSAAPGHYMPPTMPSQPPAATAPDPATASPVESTLMETRRD